MDRGSRDDTHIGFCILHQQAVTRFKFNVKCRVARRGKKCKHFTEKIPEWRKDFNRNPKKRRFKNVK